MPPTLPSSDQPTDVEPAPLAAPPIYLGTGLLMAALWITLVGPEDATSWIIGLPAVIAATFAHWRLSRNIGARLHPGGLVRLLPLFLVGSLRGGLDVARRVMGPRLLVDPGFFDYRLRLALPAAQVLFANLVSLLPGTLSADLVGDRLRVHALDQGQDGSSELARLEEAVAAAFGIRLPQGRATSG